MGATLEAIEHRFFLAERPTLAGALRLKRAAWWAAKREHWRDPWIEVWEVRRGEVCWGFEPHKFYGRRREIMNFGDLDGYLLVRISQWSAGAPPDREELRATQEANVRDYLTLRERVITQRARLEQSCLIRRIDLRD